MDIKTIRKLNVRLLEREIGSLSALASKAGLSRPYLQSCVSNTLAFRPLGDDAARRLEHSMGKPHGWMDVSHMDENHLVTARLVYEKLIQVSTSKVLAVAELLDMKLTEGFPVGDSSQDGSSSTSQGRVITLEDDAPTTKKRQHRGQSKT